MLVFKTVQYWLFFGGRGGILLFSDFHPFWSICFLQGAMMSIAFKEGLKIPPPAMNEIILAANQDIRQVSDLWLPVFLFCCQLTYSSTESGYSFKHQVIFSTDVLQTWFRQVAIMLERKGFEWKGDWGSWYDREKQPHMAIELDEWFPRVDLRGMQVIEQNICVWMSH